MAAAASGVWPRSSLGPGYGPWLFCITAKYGDPNAEFKVRTAVGADWLRPRDVMHLSDELLRIYIQIFGDQSVQGIELELITLVTAGFMDYDFHSAGGLASPSGHWVPVVRMTTLRVASSGAAPLMIFGYRYSLVASVLATAVPWRTTCTCTGGPLPWRRSLLSRCLGRLQSFGGASSRAPITPSCSSVRTSMGRASVEPAWRVVRLRFLVRHIAPDCVDVRF